MRRIFAAGFFAATFLATGCFTAAFFAGAFLATGFFAAAFLVAVLLAAPLLALALLAGDGLPPRALDFFFTATGCLPDTLRRMVPDSSVVTRRPRVIA